MFSSFQPLHFFLSFLSSLLPYKLFLAAVFLFSLQNPAPSFFVHFPPHPCPDYIILHHLTSGSYCWFLCSMLLPSLPSWTWQARAALCPELHWTCTWDNKCLRGACCKGADNGSAQPSPILLHVTQKNFILRKVSCAACQHPIVKLETA